MPHEQTYGDRHHLAITGDALVRILNAATCGLHVLLSRIELLAHIIRVLRMLKRTLQAFHVFRELRQLFLPGLQIAVKMHFRHHELGLVSKRIIYAFEVIKATVGEMLAFATQLANIVEHVQLTAIQRRTSTPLFRAILTLRRVFFAYEASSSPAFENSLKSLT